jgi:type IV pilus assembly protein PilE
MKRYEKGVTLIELMIAVAIIAILAGIAYPSYLDHVRVSRRTEAQAALVKIANLQERNYTDTGSYATDLTNLGLGANPYITENGFYSISSASANVVDNYTLTATASGAQATDTYCAVLVLRQDNSKTGTTHNDCWN